MKFYDAVINFLFPPRCVSCGAEGSVLCERCSETILAHKTHTCPAPHGVDRLLFFASYQKNPVLKKAIVRSKYAFVRDASGIFGKHLAEILVENNLKNAVLVPVPLHWRRQFWRGFNQAEILAEEIARCGDFSVEKILKRVRNTKPQVQIKNRQERLENIVGAFAVVGEIDPEKNYVLVDDVSTTGGTLGACAQALRKAGAKHVSAVVIAHE